MLFRTFPACAGRFFLLVFTLAGLLALDGCSSCNPADFPNTGKPDASLSRNCESGNAPACKQAADNLLARHPEALTEARPLYLRACQGGYMPGCSAYAIMLKDGLGGSEDKTEAARLMSRACKSGDADGCLGVYHMMQAGDGMDADPHRARDFLAQSVQLRKSACLRGQADDCAAAADHIEGESAAELLEHGCKLGDRTCCERVGRTLPKNADTKPDTHPGL
jgi:TPR repeat protein